MRRSSALSLDAVRPRRALGDRRAWLGDMVRGEQPNEQEAHAVPGGLMQDAVDVIHVGSGLCALRVRAVSG